MPRLAENERGGRKVTHIESRNAYIKEVAKLNNITTPDKLLTLHAAIVTDINSVPWSELEKLFDDIRRDSAATNAKPTKESVMKVGGA